MEELKSELVSAGVIRSLPNLVTPPPPLNQAKKKRVTIAVEHYTVGLFFYRKDPAFLGFIPLLIRAMVIFSTY